MSDAEEVTARVLADMRARGETQIVARLKRAALSIRAEANGRICGTCAGSRLSAGVGYCVDGLNHQGESLKIFKHDAVACSEHRERIA